MDRRKWTVTVIVLLIVAAIISYFHQNHTKTTKPNPIEKPTPPIKVVTKTIRFRTGIIDHSLFSAERNAGLTGKMDKQLNTMFAHESVMHDLHPGDRLEVLFHEYFVNDKRNHPGNIVAAEIVGKNTKIKVVRFTEPNGKAGYYTANGNSTQPAFMRIPLHYVRIGSYFSYDRYDPVVHRVQPHLGVDLDAPMGTPIKAIGNGVVTFCGQMRGYGNVIMIQYHDAYKTLYAHLERFVGGMHLHEHVKKDQVVGYVGCTGWCTGPHVHFAVFKNGVAVNPLTVQFPSASTVPEEYRSAFFADEDKWFEEMKAFEKNKGR